MWGSVTGLRKQRLILVDNSLCEPAAVPGPIEKVPSYDDMEAEMSRGGYAGRSLFKDVVGKNYLTSNTAVWHRLAEIRLWFLVGYPVGMMVDADWKERVVTWDKGFSMPNRAGWRGIQLPANPFDFVRTAWNPKGLTS